MMSNCGVCGGSRVTGTTTFTVDYKTGVVVARNVPALVCTQCGEESIADEVAAKLESLSETARQEGKQIEVIHFGLTAAA